MGYGGYLNPFTGEAQINGQLPTLAFITTSAHEQAHQSGIAVKNEANFLAFLKTYKHANPYIRYAGTALHCVTVGMHSIETIRLCHRNSLKAEDRRT